MTIDIEVLFKDIKQTLSQIKQSDFSFRHKVLELRNVLDRCCKDFTESETLQFPSLFSRIVFIAQQYKLPRNLEQNLHRLRILSNFLLRNENHLATERQFNHAYDSLHGFILFLEGKNSISVESWVDEISSINCSLGKLRVQVIDLSSDDNYVIICRPKDTDEYIISVRCNDITFKDTFNRLWIGAQLNLIDCKIDSEGSYIPAMIVLEPDYLIDASAMAECFQSYGSSHLHYFRRKFEPMSNTHYILLGNLANFFLDELIYAEDAKNLKFETVFLRSFKRMPFEFTACKDIESDEAFRPFMIRAKQQFVNIKRVVLEDMKENGFVLDRCVLEPSFYSETYGFQGRLDLLQPGTDNSSTRIIELKSGKTPWPHDDIAKIAPNHETQTSVYRLMIQSVFNCSDRDIYTMILYSSADIKGQNLRLSAPYKQLEKEIVNARNLIVATEHDLYTGNAETVKQIFSELFKTENYEGRIPDFFENKLADSKKVLSSCTELERLYFYRYVSFVCRELYLQKAGDEGYDTSVSTSSLWNTSFQERKDALELVANLEIEDIEENLRDMKIRFRRNESSESNFREGEICIVYPRQSDADTILSNQVLKGTIIEISIDYILVRFRYKQRNSKYFEENKYWVIEHDKLDHAFNAMYRSLFDFLQSPTYKKELLLGLRKPESTYIESSNQNITKEEYEAYVVDKALAAEDYFLIVGPPGTGKTSIFARRLIERYYAQPDTDILVLAYTNRAVDELCAAICLAFKQDASECQSYIRIGSEYSCNKEYRHRLLQNISEGARKREDLRNVIESTRIYVGTLASIIGKPELFEMKHFDIAIIDEASQILEPQIIGLLPLFDRFIMIGDHKQLSTITVQNQMKSIVDDKMLNEIGLYDCRESIFERLFRIVQQQGWESAYTTLCYHGRMHEDIARLVNNRFYEGKLIPATSRQIEPLENDRGEIVNKRVIFVNVNKDGYQNLSAKISTSEAKVVVEIAVDLFRQYSEYGKTFDPDKTIGIIASYRNQIALIKQMLQQTGIPELQQIMVDTVERYQGSQRDIIIISFCFNYPYQFKSFVNMNREKTVDRKLNVALTRAREQLFLIGNEQLLKQNQLYVDLLKDIEIGE